MAKITQTVNGASGLTARTNFNTSMRSVEVTGGITGTGESGNPISAQDALDGKVDQSQVLTNVPAGAVFTDTPYDDSSVLVDSDTVTAVNAGNKIVTEAQISVFGDMYKSDYDTNNSGVVDNATLVNGLSVQTAVPAGALFIDTVYDDSNTLVDSDTVTPVTVSNKIITEADVTGGGDMLKATYDANNDGTVDDSNLVNGLTVETAVPQFALFTDSDTTDHAALSNIGTSSHAQIDTHLADSTEHFTESSISHTAISGIGTNTHAEIDTHLSNTSNPHSITSLQAGAVGNNDTESGASSVLNCVFITQANYDLLTPVSTTLYIING